MWIWGFIVGDILEVKVGLCSVEVDINLFVVDFVFDIGEENEGCDNIMVMVGFYMSFDVVVLYVISWRNDGIDIVFRYG